MTCALPEQSVKVTDEGLTLTGVAGVGHAPAPAPLALTGTVVVDVPSDTVTLPPEKTLDGLTRRTERILPLMVAVTLPLLDAVL